MNGDPDRLCICGCGRPAKVVGIWARASCKARNGSDQKAVNAALTDDLVYWRIDYKLRLVVDSLRADMTINCAKCGSTFSGPGYLTREQYRAHLCVPTTPRNTRKGMKHVRDLIVRLAEEEGMSRRQIADRLNDAGQRTHRGNLWHPTNVFEVLREERPDAYRNLGRANWMPGDPTPVCPTHGIPKVERTINKHRGRLWICRLCVNEASRRTYHARKLKAAA